MNLVVKGRCLMYRFRFGTLFALLREIRNTSSRVYHNQQEFYAGLTDPKNTQQLLTNGNVTSLVNGADKRKAKIRDEDITELTSLSIDELTAHYQSKIIPYLKATMLKPLVLAIRAILSSDTSIPDNEVFILDEVTKNNLLNIDVICLPKVLACLIKYLIEKPNYKEKDEDNIPENFVSTFATSDEQNKLKIHTRDEEIKTPLEKTINDGNFSNTFKEFDLGFHSLNLNNTSKFKVYVLDVYEPEKLNTPALKKFIISNITKYTCSRTRLSKERLDNDEFSIGYEVLMRLKERTGTSFTEVFSQIMIYSFMEASLHAPKLYSAYELKSLNSDFKTNISGVYLLPHGSVDNSNNQLVFGSSNVNNTIEAAINNVLHTTKIISNSSFNLRRFLDDKVLNNNDFDDSTIKFLKGVIRPSKNDTPIINSFGIFFSYSINSKNINTYDINEYRNEINNQINHEITNCIPYIEAKIKDLDLNKYPFYFFVLPLINAEDVSSQILREIFEVR